MKIHCMFGKRRSATELEIGIELMVAWDEYGIEENFEGWEDACRAARESWDDDLETVRFVEFEVDGEAIQRLFKPATMTGKLVEPG